MLGIILAAITLEDSGSFRKDTASVVVISRDGTHETLIENGYAPKYLPTGHLVFVRHGALFGAPFDLGQMKLTGPETRVLSQIFVDSIWAIASYDVADDGTLIYVRGGDYSVTVPTWLDRQGSSEPLAIPSNFHGTFALSPDRSRLAVQVMEAEDQIHLYDFSRKSFAQLTFDGPSGNPTWSHDGREIYFAASREGASTVMRRGIDSAGEEIRLLTAEQFETMQVKSAIPY